MNHSNLEGVIHLYDHKMATALARFKKLRVMNLFSDSIGLKASLVQNASLTIIKHNYITML